MAGINILTDRAIKEALKRAAAATRPVKIVDGAGLHLEARPTGVGWWRLRYRFGGKEQMLSLGVYPDVGLAMARQRRDDARKLVAAGVDPSAQRKAEKVAQAQELEVQALAADGKPLPGSFEFVARDWLETVHRAKVSEGHADRTLIRFENDAFPWLGSRPIAELEAPEILNVLRRVLDRGAIESTHRLKDAIGQVFRYGIATGACSRNPAADLRDALPPVPTRHLAAVVDPKQVAGLLRSIQGYVGHPVTRAALELSALLFLRPGELRQLEWSWIDFESALLTIPSTLMKRRKDQKANGDPHLVPLAPQALAILRGDLQPLTGAGRFVFPALHGRETRSMSENTVRSALRRLGYGNDDMTAHGFRAMARTMAAERLGIQPEVIEAQLAHAVSDDLGRAYNRTQYLAQRRELMVRWADYLDELRRGEGVGPPGSVT